MQYALIAVMGAIGAFTRALLEAVIPDGVFPLTTLIINIIGCFMLEIVYDYLGRRSHWPKEVVKGMGVGLVGSFTTLSAFSKDTIMLLQQGSVAIALLNISVTLVVCFVSAVLGHVCCNLLALHRIRKLLAQRESQHANKSMEEIRR